MAEPVATLAACLCGLDTNPVASPRMDIHCPKHDAPESGGEPGDSTCKWCAKGDAPKVLDCDGTLISITGEVGVLSHAHEEYWWPCLRFGVELHSAAQPSPTPADGEFQPWYENYERALRLQSCDEEVAREVVDGVYSHYVTAYRGEEERRMFIARITAALARRAGTPTTEARERAKGVLKWMEQNAYLNVQWIMKSARKEDKYADELFALAKVRNEIIDHIASALSSTPSKSRPAEVVEEILDDWNGSYEHYALSGAPTGSAAKGQVNQFASEVIAALKTATPSDEVAQRARAAAEEIERVYDRDTTEIEEVEAIISKHFTVTDVEGDSKEPQ